MMSRPASRSSTKPVGSTAGQPAERRERILLFLVATAASVAIAWLYLPFLLGQKNFIHDSLVPATLIGLFYDRAFGGDSWLWSVALNGGHPLWVSLETTPFLDPIAGVIYSLATASGSAWFPPYYMTAFVWFFAFAVGGALCAREITNNNKAALLVLVLMMCGPIVLVIPVASNGFLIPFRYFGLTVWLYLRMRRKTSFANVFAFTIVLSFSMAGYLTIYPFIMLCALFMAELIVGRLRFLKWLRETITPRNLASLLIPVLVLAPSLVWLMYTENLVPVPHAYRHGNVYFFPFKEFLWGMLLAYLELIVANRVIPVWHGSTFLGFLVLPFLLLGLRRGLGEIVGVLQRRGSEDQEAYWRGVLLAWLVLTVVLSCGFFGLREFVETEGALFKIRNFGFLLSGALLLLALIAGCGFSEIMKGRYRWHDIVKDTFTFACLTVVAVWIYDFEAVDAVSIVNSVGAFALVSLIWWRLRAGFPRLFALTVVAAVFVELFAFARSGDRLINLEDMAERTNREGVSELVRTHMRRLGAHREDLPDTRQFMFQPQEHWPFHLEGPAISGVAVAYSKPLTATPLGNLGLFVTHLFRLKNYDRLVNSPVAQPRIQQILGVTRPILELVPRGAVVSGTGGLSLVLREDAGGPPQPRRAVAGEIAMIDYQGDRLRVGVETAEDAVLVYRDNMAPGWSVALDGEAAELLVVDRVNKAVAVPPGQHRVEFLYRPWPYLVAFALRALALVAAVVACAWIGLRARHKIAVSV